MRGLGTVVNVATVVVGAVVGLRFGRLLPEAARATMLTGVGLATLGIGVSSFLETDNAAFPVVAVVLGGLLGALLDLETRLESLGEGLRRRFATGSGSATFVEGFVAASLLFCVGPLTILGSFEDGARGDPQLLVVKAALDGLVAIPYAASFGVGVAFSAITVALSQGALTLLAVGLGDVLGERAEAELTATGGVLILGIGLRLLDVKRVPVASYLPALVLAPVLVALVAD